MPRGVYPHKKGVPKPSVSKSNSLRVLSEDTRKKLSLATVRRIQEGTFGSHNRSNGKWFTDRLGRRMFLRSSYELQFAQWLDKRSLTWEYQRKLLDVDSIHYVLPDFYVQEWGSYVEVKAVYYRDEGYEMKRLLECFYRVSCYLVMDNELKDLDSWVNVGFPSTSLKVSTG